MPNMKIKLISNDDSLSKEGVGAVDFVNGGFMLSLDEYKVVYTSPVLNLVTNMFTVSLIQGQGGEFTINTEFGPLNAHVFCSNMNYSFNNGNITLGVSYQLSMLGLRQDMEMTLSAQTLT